MLIEAARRAEAAVKEMLACADEGAASCSELREGLEISKVIAGVNAAFQVSAAASVAGRERHGDGGAEVLAVGAGLSRHEARSQVKTAETLSGTLQLRDAVAGGRVSTANAKRLAEAVEKTSAEDVASDGELLAKAETMRPEDFGREARRWAVERQGDNGESEHARQRARRRVRIWDGDDGMVHLRGEFDTVTGRRIGNRLRAEAARMHDADKKNANHGDDRRSFDQCMADALDQLTSNANDSASGGKPYADICVVAHVDDETGELIAEIPGGDRLPRSVLEELTCNSLITPTIYDRRGVLLWQGHSKRTATATQLKALKAIYGGCFACGADFDMTQAHHVRPVSQGGRTDIDNLVPACWGCHNKIHHFGWQIHGPPGKRTLHPPGAINYGPAHAPDAPVLDISPAEAPCAAPGADAPVPDNRPAGMPCAARAPDAPVPDNRSAGPSSAATGDRLFALA